MECPSRVRTAGLDQERELPGLFPETERRVADLSTIRARTTNAVHSSDWFGPYERADFFVRQYSKQRSQDGRIDTFPFQRERQVPAKIVSR
jgi:hypothetical protein